MNDRPLVTMKEASTFLRVSDQVIRKRIRDGKLECVREKGKVLFTQEQLDGYVESLKTTGPEEAQPAPPAGQPERRRANKKTAVR